MATAVAPKRLTLREDYTHQPGPCKVDREKGVIFDVKVSGAESANRRRYLPECYRDAEARKLYEGAKVHADHPLKAGEQRPVRGLLGKLIGLYERGGEMFAREFHILKSHPLAESVFEDCERGLGVYGLSHNAEADAWDVTPEGVQVIKRLARVESVDLVADPATNSNLWEGRTVADTPALKKIKVAALLERVAADTRLPGGKRIAVLGLLEKGRKNKYGHAFDGAAFQGALDAGFSKAQAAAMARKGEAVEPGMGMDMDEPAGDADPREMLADAVGALLMSDDVADHDLADKIRKLLKPESAEEPTEEAEDDEEDDEEDDGKKKPFGKESKGKRARRAAAPRLSLLTEARAKALIKVAGLTETAELLEALTGLDEDRALRVIELAKGKAAPGGTARTSAGPRSAPAGTITEARQVQAVPTEPKALASWLNSK